MIKKGSRVSWVSKLYGSGEGDVLTDPENGAVLVSVDPDSLKGKNAGALGDFHLVIRCTLTWLTEK